MDQENRQDLRPLLILIVEDEFLIAMDVEMTVQSLGHRVLGPAASVAEALALLHLGRPDVGLLDFNIQGQTVIAVAERLNELQIPILVMSAYDPVHLGRHEALIAAQILKKPLEDEALRRAIHSATQVA